MAKKTPQTTETPAQPEFWVQEQGDDVLLVLARTNPDGTMQGKARLLPKDGLTIYQFGRVYEQMLHDYQADHNEQL